jgi:hypothetical protein
MSRVSRIPERLRSAGATDFERRLLQSGAREQPPRELSERMAAGIGVSAPVLLAAPAPTLKPVAPTSAAAVGARALWPWLSGAVVALAVGGVVLGVRSHTHAVPAVHAVHVVHVSSRPAVVPLPARAALSASPSTPSVPLEATPAPQPAAPSPPRPAIRVTVTTSADDLRAQITLIDAARAAVSAKAGDRALSLLREYESKYAAGSFRPEARALKIEALAAAGRTAEARALADRFVTEYRGTPLAKRVARAAGLASSE